MPQAIGITGPRGSGKKYVAQHIVNTMIANHKSHSEGILILRPNEKGTISIEQSRTLANFLRLKDSHSNNHRIVIIEDAQSMTNEAQNAVLKTLEEPPSRTTIILTYTTESVVLPTITSRLQNIEIKQIPLDSVTTFFKKDFDVGLIKKYYQISNGRISLIHAMLCESDHQLINSIETAKKALSSSAYERLAMMDAMLKYEIHFFLDALLIITTVAFNIAIKNKDINRAKKLAIIRINVFEAINSSARKPNDKLLLTDLMLKI